MAKATNTFFPEEYKQFPFKEGDLLVSDIGDGRFAVNKILKVDRFDLKQGSSINIQGQAFTAPVDDYLLVVSAAFGVAEFTSLEEARAAALAKTWKVKIGHVPNRAPGAAADQVLVGYEPVTDAELTGYNMWKEMFIKGEAGIF